MPFIKFISGNSPSCRNIYEYLYRDDRSIGDAVFNIDGRETVPEGEPWWSVMDRTRRDCGTQRAMANGRARRYEHIVISPDPRDDVGLEDFRDYIDAFVSEWFDDKVGRFQVAVVYHDDNSERIAEGEEGILHAHIIINNTELETSRRLSPRLTNQVIGRMCDAVNKTALDYGWHAFASNGASLTREEMAAQGLSVGRGRCVRGAMDMHYETTVPGEEPKDLRPEDRPGPAVEGAGGRPRDTGNAPDTPDKVASATGRGGDADAPGSEDGTDRDSRKGASGASGEHKPYILEITDPTGKTVRIDATKLGISRQDVRRTREEMAAMERKGWSWKGDIRDRLDTALRLAGSVGDFRELCDMMGIGIEYNSQGQIKFTHPTAPDTRQVLGSTLGAAYTAEAIAERLSRKHADRVQRAAANARTERYMDPRERAAVAREAREIGTDDARHTRRFRRLADLIAYNDAHSIHSYEDYPGDAEGREALSYARLLGLFDAGHQPTRRAETAQQAADRRAYERDARGVGGPNAAQGRDSRPQGPNGPGGADEASRDDRGRGPKR